MSSSSFKGALWLEGSGNKDTYLKSTRLAQKYGKLLPRAQD